MRSSDWKITWDPEGGSPLVLLDLDDLMDREIHLAGEQLFAWGKSDFQIRAVALPRANAKRRLEFKRRLQHPTIIASWQASWAALKAAPWGLKATFRIEPRGGVARNYMAALLSSSHRPASDDGFVESVHEYAFRVNPIPTAP